MNWEEFQRECDALERKYGVPWEELPPILRDDPPEHPRRRIRRRGIYHGAATFDQWIGWRLLRDGSGGYYRFGFNHDLDRRRRALVEVRQRLSRRKGRGRQFKGRRPVPDWRRAEEGAW